MWKVHRRHNSTGSRGHPKQPCSPMDFKQTSVARTGHRRDRNSHYRIEACVSVTVESLPNLALGLGGFGFRIGQWRALKFSTRIRSQDRALTSPAPWPGGGSGVLTQPPILLPIMRQGGWTSRQLDNETGLACATSRQNDDDQPLPSSGARAMVVYIGWPLDPLAILKVR